MNQNTRTLKWTAAAGEILERYFTRRLVPGHLEGADPEEVRADLTAHIETELSAAGLRTVTAEAVGQALARMGESLPAENVPYAPPASATPDTITMPALPAKPSVLSRFNWLMLGGVIWPVVALLFEILTGDCADLLFDPIPTIFHVLLVALVPVTCFIATRFLRGRLPLNWRAAVHFLRGVALLVSCWYTVLFAVFVPYAIPGIALMGMGLLALAPLAALLAVLLLGKKLRAQGESSGQPQGRACRRGICVAVVAVLALDGRELLTRITVHAALKATPPSAGWVQALRRAGSTEVIRQMAYEGRKRESMRPGNAPVSPAGFLTQRMNLAVRDEAGEFTNPARDLFFRITGESFSAKPVPKRWRPLRGFFGNNAVDYNRGSNTVAGVTGDLSLRESRMDWHVEDASGLAWGEWTFDFQNNGQTAEEARCRIRLPQDGCVSRLTLWVNGQPEEAAYASVPTVKAAYKSVAVVQQRDPVLLTQPEPGVVFMQCFPVPAGGRMKVRVTFTAPLPADGRFLLPVLVEQNFDISPDTTFPLWVQARGALDAPPEYHASIAPVDGFSVLTCRLPQALLAGRGTAFTCKGKPAEKVWCSDPFAPQEKQAITATRTNAGPGAGTVAVVVDGSAGMGPHAPALAAALGTLPAIPFMVFLAGEQETPAAAELQSAVRTVRDFSFTGGVDNTPALLSAIDWLRGKPSPVLLWVHGPQPLSRHNRSGLEQVLERGGFRGTLCDCPAGSGENTIMRAFQEQPGVTTRALWWDGTAAMLPGLFRMACGGCGPAFTWNTEPAGTQPPPGAVQVSETLARWHALDLYRALAPGDRDAAIKLAATYQLVTPLTGAVVLEKKSDYAAHGLKQTSGKLQQVPVIPEPSSSLLLFGGGLVLLRRTRKTPRR